MHAKTKRRARNKKSLSPVSEPAQRKSKKKRRKEASTSESTSESRDEESAISSNFAVSKGKRATYISIVKDARDRWRRKKKGEKAYLPTFLRQPKAKSEDFPIFIDCHHELIERKQGRSGKYDKMADIIAASYQENKSEKGRGSKSPLGGAIFAMRGFGTFDVGLGIGSYGQDLTGAIRRRSNNEKDLFREDGIKYNMSNRIIAATIQLEFGSKRVGAEGEDYAQLGDFLHMGRGRVGDSFACEKTDASHKPPLTLNTFAKCVNNQIHYRWLIFGKSQRKRKAAAECLVRMRDEAPKLPKIPVLVSVWGQMMMDYDDKVIEGVRRLRQLSSITDTRADLRRAALTPKKRNGSPEPPWQYPRTFAVEEEGDIGCGQWCLEWRNPWKQEESHTIWQKSLDRWTLSNRTGNRKAVEWRTKAEL